MRHWVIVLAKARTVQVSPCPWSKTLATHCLLVKALVFFLSSSMPPGETSAIVQRKLRLAKRGEMFCVTLNWGGGSKAWIYGLVVSFSTFIWYYKLSWCNLEPKWITLSMLIFMVSIRWGGACKVSVYIPQDEKRRRKWPEFNFVFRCVPLWHFMS